MSENLDLVRSIYAAWERGDYSSSAWADREIETIIADGPSPSRSKGLAGMAHLWGDFLSAWTDFRIEVEEYRDLDEQRVLVLDRFIARGKTSGLELGETGPQRYRVKPGATVSDLLDTIGIAADTDLTVAVDGELAARETPLREGAEVMLLSPMEGGR